VAHNVPVPTDPHAIAALVERAARRPPGDLPEVVAEVACEVWGAADVVLALATHELTDLVSMTGTGSRRRSEPVEHGAAGSCFTSGEPVSDGPTTWVPVGHHGARLGVLGVAAPEPPPLDALTAYAEAVGLHLAASRGFSDGVEITRRTQEMAVGAELLQALSPPLGYTDERFTLAAVLEPSYSWGGDAVDHAVEGDTLHALVLDATGHGWGAALVGAVAVAAYRSARRNGEDLLGCWAALERYVGDVGETQEEARYATAVVVEVDLGTGRTTWLSAGHPPPVVVRADGSVEVWEAEPAPPLGTGLGLEPDLGEEYLEPGDVLALHTDGMTEARALDGSLLGLDGWLDALRAGLADGGTLAERLRRVVRDLFARDDAWMGDDASALLVEWSGPADR
jgi:hypothetical protein